MKLNRRNILIIAPHGDDEILGCGGTMNKLIHQNYKIFVAVMTNANLGNPKLYDLNFLKKIRRETEKCHKYLGVYKTFFYDFPATQLNNFPLNKIIDSISILLQQIKPISLFIPHSNDIHIDHKIINHSSLVAARPLGSLKEINIYEYETLSETEWSENYKFIPNYFSILNQKDINKKINSMMIYKSQIKKYPHPRSIESIKSLSIVRGSNIGQKFAESFVIKRLVN